MNETFDFKRFWTYFKYDLVQMWRNHSKAAILIGGASALFYVVWVLFSLIFTQTWTSPVIEARFFVFFFAFLVLEFYQTRTYGYLTEKKAGSAWLMVPASRTEKFVSMLLVTLVVIPLLFVTVYFVLDGFLSLVDPTYGKALAVGFMETYEKFLNGLVTFNSQSPILVTTPALTFMTFVGFVCNFLYFLLCGICFKKNKIGCAIAILFGTSLLFSLLTGILVPGIVNHMDIDLSEGQLAQWLANLMNLATAFSCLLAIGLGWGVWRRIKTIQH